MWAKITKDNTFVEGGMIEMQEAIQKRAMGEGSYMIPSFDYSAYSSIGIIQLNFILKKIYKLMCSYRNQKAWQTKI